MVVSLLCSCVSDPRQIHYDAALVVIGYLVATKNLGITFGGHLRTPLGLVSAPFGFVQSLGLHCYHDSSWGQVPRPMGGYVIMHNNGCVDWASKSVKIVPDSTCEAETAVASFASKATCFLRMLFTFHKIPVTAATPMLGDCKASYDLITQDGASARTRYFERATLLIKRAVLMLILLPFHISTNFMVADLMTKVTDKGTFIRLRNHMMNVHSELRTSLADTMFKIHGEASLLVERLMRKL